MISGRQTSHKVKGLVLGTGPMEAFLKNLAKERGLLGKYVEFLGNQEDVASIYQQAAILVLPSAYEGTPNVVLEAMATGLPIVATNVGGIPDLIKDSETGYLTKPRGIFSTCGGDKNPC